MQLKQVASALVAIKFASDALGFRVHLNLGLWSLVGNGGGSCSTSYLALVNTNYRRAIR